MWNDTSVQGGGYFNSPSQFGDVNTPGAAAKKGGRRSNRTAPVTISQILKSSDDGVKIWGLDIQLVSVVARVKDIKVHSTRVIYTLQDMTGAMQAILWFDQDAMSEEEKSIPNVMVNTYVQVVGSVKTNQGKKVLMVFHISSITNINAITFHYLQCINNKIKLEAKSKAPKTNGDLNTSHSTMPSNSMVNMDIGAGGAMGCLNPRQLMVFNLIRATPVEAGLSKDDMQLALKDKMAKAELEKILEWMCSEGHIYSTIDEDHFRATDAF